MVEPSTPSHTTPRRAPVPKRVRFEVLRRDNYTCRYCRSTDNPLTIDHVIPDVLGGSNDPSNLVAACKDCNAGKASSSPDEATVAQVSEEQLRWARAVRLAASRALAEQEAMIERLGPFFDYWYEFVPGYRRGNPAWEMPGDWDTAVAGLLAAGLPEAIIKDSMQIALTARVAADRFRYFLGVARNRLADLHAEAQRLLDSGEV